MTEIPREKWRDYFASPTPILLVCPGSDVAAFPKFDADLRVQAADKCMQLAEEVLGTFPSERPNLRVAALTWHSATDNGVKLELLRTEPDLVSDETKYIAENMFAGLQADVTLLGLCYGSFFAQELGTYFSRTDQSAMRGKFCALGVAHIGASATARETALPGVYCVGNNDKQVAYYSRSDLQLRMKVPPEDVHRILPLTDDVAIFTSLIPREAKRWMIRGTGVEEKTYKDKQFHHSVGYLAAAPGSTVYFDGSTRDCWSHSLLIREIFFNMCGRKGPIDLNEMLVVKERSALPYFGHAELPGPDFAKKLMSEARKNGINL